jgi:uncharacterized protein YcaQ
MKRLREHLLATGDIVEVRVDSWKKGCYVLGADVSTLETLAAGRTPKAWKPLDTDTTEEALFLAPLDWVSARGRAKELFGIEYIWEVYKPEAKRKYGYYVLPVLWGERIVARFDSKLDRENNIFVILGFWLEDAALGKNAAFAEALARAFARFTAFLGADKIDARAISEPLLRKRVSAGSRP